MIRGKGFSWDCFCRGERQGGTSGSKQAAKEAAEAALESLPPELRRHAILQIEGPHGAIYRYEPARRSQMVWRRVPGALL